nr:ARID DNA-binding domain-containing protein [Tanacetum cinerariifolium]
MKKSLSLGCKEMLLEKMKEIETFNASRVSTKARYHEEGSASTQKEKRARCYICKIRRHVFWKCPNKKKKAMSGKLKEIVKPTFKKFAEKVKYPEKVHVITNYMIEGTRSLFKKLKYKFKMIEKEEIEKKFIFSYSVGDVTVEETNGNFVIPNVHYRPEVTLNVLSYDLLEEQGYTVEISNNKCYIHYMFGGKGKRKAQVESVSEDDGLREVVTEHNKFLDKYFESIEPKDEGSLVKGLEELKWDRDDEDDYVDEEYISWNGSLYATKVNSLPRFLSFMNLIKKDGMVYKNWDIFIVGVMEINLLSLHKIVDNLGGYLCVTLGDKWKTVAGLQGLTDDDGEAIKECYRKFIDMVKPKEDVVENSSGNMEEEAEQGSITDINDFEVIV